MNFEIKTRNTLNDGSTRIIVEVESSDLIYFGFFLEAHEGWCNYTTLSKKPPQVQIDISPDFLNEMNELFSVLKKWEK